MYIYNISTCNSNIYFVFFQNTTWNSSFQRTCVALNMSDRYLDYDFTYYEKTKECFEMSKD